MKSTGVLRRIDELGRIVIPKEIRKNLKIRNGELLEIFVNDDSIILQKHSMINNINDTAALCVESFSEVNKMNIIIVDRDKVVAASGPFKKKYIGKEISKDILDKILKREALIENEVNVFKIDLENTETAKFLLVPIIASGDAVGAVMILSEETSFIESDIKFAQFIAKILSKQVE